MTIEEFEFELDSSFWPEFGGIYYYMNGDEKYFVYKINNEFYSGLELLGYDDPLDFISFDSANRIKINTNGSNILVVTHKSAGDIFYQQLSSGEFVQLTHNEEVGEGEILDVHELIVPLPHSRKRGCGCIDEECYECYESLPLKEFGFDTRERIQQRLMEKDLRINHDNSHDICGTEDGPQYTKLYEFGITGTTVEAYTALPKEFTLLLGDSLMSQETVVYKIYNYDGEEEEEIFENIFGF